MKGHMLRELGLVVALLVGGAPQAAVAVDYVIDGTGGDCAGLGGVWETTTSPPRCTVNAWTLAPGDRLVVETGAALHLRGSNLNAGAIHNGGTIEVGELYSDVRSTITNTGVISNTGTLWVGAEQYAFTVGNQGQGTVTNPGAIENAGTIEIGGGSVVTSTGTITNLAAGIVRNRSDRVLPYWCCEDGRLENGGTIHNAGTVYVVGAASNLGLLDNGPTGAITLQLYGYFDPLGRGGGFSASTLENDGRIDNSGTMDSHGGDVQNRGHIANGGAFRNYVEFFLYSTYVGGPKVWRLGSVRNDSTVANDGVIVDCGDVWDGSAPTGNPIVRQSCIGFLPQVTNFTGSRGSNQE